MVIRSMILKTLNSNFLECEDTLIVSVRDINACVVLSKTQLYGIKNLEVSRTLYERVYISFSDILGKTGSREIG